MFEAVKTGSGEGAVTGRSSRWRILRLPAAWWRCGIGLTRNLLVGSVMGSVEVDPMCRKRRKISSFLLTDHGVQTADHAWLRASVALRPFLLLSPFFRLGLRPRRC